jgi:hypothetical protein
VHRRIYGSVTVTRVLVDIILGGVILSGTHALFYLSLLVGDRLSLLGEDNSVRVLDGNGQAMGPKGFGKGHKQTYIPSTTARASASRRGR